ncbi:MAG: VWA domain-containing protein [Sandaracinaceae bacterium]|nr:VWA domain-containing protein [Sandaracinaceae bacterium]
MSEVELTVGWPLALWGLALIPVIVLLAIRSRFPIGWKRRAMGVVVTRVVAIALLIAAVSDVRMGWPTEELAVATVVDGTSSITDADRARVREELGALASQHAEVSWVSPGEGADVEPATDVSVGVAMLPRDRVRRMVVATDGRDRGGDLGAAIAAARRAGVVVSILPMGDEPPIDLVSVRGLSVPRMVRAGDRLDVGVEMHAARDANVEITLTIDGAEVSRGEAVARRGDSSAHLPVTFPEEEGVHRVGVTIRAGGDVIAANDEWSSLVRVSPKPRVRILHDPQNGPPALARVLEEGGMRVDVTAMISAPTRAAALEPYSLVVVDEADPQDLTEDQQQALRTWVEEEGGGLVTITGTNAVRRTPRILREIEPVTVPPAIPEPRPLELVLVIDRSSSMSGIKIMQARNAGVAAVRALRQDARVGVVAFSGAADRVMAPVGSDQFDQAISFIQAIHASGGTGHRRRAPRRQLGDEQRSALHPPRDPALGRSQRGRARAPGRASAGGPRREHLRHHARPAQRPDGADRAHRPRPLPRDEQRRLAAEPLRARGAVPAAARAPPRHRAPARGHAARHARRSALRHGAAAPRPRARGDAPRGHDRPRDAGPLPDPRALAPRPRSGGDLHERDERRLGRPVAGVEGFREFWVSLSEGMLRTRPVDPPQLRVTPHPLVEGVEVLTVLAPTIESEPMPIVRLYREPGEGEAIELAPRGPGVWQADVIEDRGFLVDARMPSDERPTVAIGFDRPYHPELSVFGSNAAELERLAAAGGGRVLSRAETILERVEEQAVMRSMRTPLLAVALALYLLGLLLLRLPDHLGERHGGAPRARAPPQWGPAQLGGAARRARRRPREALHAPLRGDAPRGLLRPRAALRRGHHLGGLPARDAVGDHLRRGGGARARPRLPRLPRSGAARARGARERGDPAHHPRELRQRPGRARGRAR